MNSQSAARVIWLAGCALVVCALARGQVAAVSPLASQCRARMAQELANVGVPSAALNLYATAMQRLPVARLADWDALESSQRRSLEDAYPVRACERLIMDLDDALEAYKARGPCAQLASSEDDQLLVELQARDARVNELVQAKTACYVFG